MSVESARVVYLPDGPCKLVNLPNALTGELQNFVVCKDVLYELREVDGHNPHDPQNHLRPTTKKDKKPVRSLILEGEGHDKKEGLVIEDGAPLVATRSNLSFLLLGYFSSQRQQGDRFQSSEDLFDTMQETYIPGLKHLPETMVQRALTNICESVVEGDEPFYKYSELKTLQWLNQRVERLSQNFPSTILESLVKPLLYPVNIDETIPDEMMQSSLIKFSISMINSYLPREYHSKLLEAHDFEALEKYVQDLKRRKIEKKAAEDNMLELNHTNAMNKRSNSNDKGLPQKKKPTSVKKAQLKVSKGALDKFFKKKIT